MAGPVKSNGNGNGNDIGKNILPWVSIVIAIGAAFWAVANPRDNINQLRTDLVQQIATLKTDEQGSVRDLRLEVERRYLSSDEYKEFKTAIEQRLSIDDAELLRLRTNYMTRTEFQRSGETTDRGLTAQSGRITELERSVNGSASIGKALDDINKRIDQIVQRQVDGMRRQIPQTTTGGSPP